MYKIFFEISVSSSDFSSDLQAPKPTIRCPTSQPGPEPEHWATGSSPSFGCRTFRSTVLIDPLSIVEHIGIIFKQRARIKGQRKCARTLSPSVQEDANPNVRVGVQGKLAKMTRRPALVAQGQAIQAQGPPS